MLSKCSWKKEKCFLFMKPNNMLHHSFWRNFDSLWDDTWIECDGGSLLWILWIEQYDGKLPGRPEWADGKLPGLLIRGILRWLGMAPGPSCPRPWFWIFPKHHEGGAGGGSTGVILPCQHSLTFPFLPLLSILSTCNHTNCTIAGLPERGEWGQMQISTSSSELVLAFPFLQRP